MKSLKTLWERMVNAILMRKRRFDKIVRQLEELLAAEATEEVFKLLLRGMELAFFIDPQFRRNLDGFNAAYAFETGDGTLNVAVTYGKGRMRVEEKKIDACNLRVTFHDYQAVIDLLSHPDPDVLDMMLNQKVQLSGNLNYAYKFAYMSRHLLFELGILRA